MPPDTPPPYHHGDLAPALLRVARRMLEEHGIAALKLRAITREAGVSATAAAPHFGNLTGLLSALAAEGYARLAREMAPRRATTPEAVARAYVRFAIANPGLFTLMFRSDALDRTDPSLERASMAAFACLSDLAGPSMEDTAARSARMTALWGKVHGIAVLAVDGHLRPLLTDRTPDGLDRLVTDALRDPA